MRAIIFATLMLVSVRHERGLQHDPRFGPRHRAGGRKDSGRGGRRGRKCSPLARGIGGRAFFVGVSWPFLFPLVFY